MRINGGGTGGLGLDMTSSCQVVKGVNCKVDALVQVNLRETEAMLHVQMSLKLSEG